MKIDLKSLRNSGKIESNFCFEYSPESDLLFIPSAVLNLPVMVTGNVTLTDKHACLVEGEICYKVKGLCTRCLAETENDYVVPFSQYVEQNNEEGYSVVNDTVDLAKIVDDEIMLNTPTTFLCSEDCKGICLGCGVNLNNERCKCK